jgi:glutamyl-tRNA reductase
MSQTIRLLSIDLRQAPPAAREAFAMKRPELDELASRTRAAADGVELLILADDERFELYTTEASRQHVYRSVLGALAERAPSEARVGIRTTEITGVAAAWHLMHRMLGSSERSGVRMLGALNVAVARARAAKNLGPELEALFECVADAGWRVQGETTLGDAESTLAEREVDWFEAERIIEEELVHWQAARAKKGVVQSIPASQLDSSYYAAAEPGSSVRLKAPQLRNIVSFEEARRRRVGA